MRKKSLIEANFKSISNLFHVSFGLFRSARASWNTSVRPSVSPLVRPQEKFDDSCGLFSAYNSEEDKVYFISKSFA